MAQHIATTILCYPHWLHSLLGGVWASKECEGHSPIQFQTVPYNQLVSVPKQRLVEQQGNDCGGSVAFQQAHGMQQLLLGAGLQWGVKITQDVLHHILYCWAWESDIEKERG